MKLTKKQTAELQAAWRQRNQEFKRAGIATESYEQYLTFVFGRAPKVKPDFSKKLKGTHTVVKTEANCIKDWTTGVCNSKQTPAYTGEKMLGVSIIHKSCLQPVFNEAAAVDAASMRR